MRIMVTGASSFVGAHLISALIKKGHSIVAIIRRDCSKLSQLPKSKYIEIIELDMSEYKYFSKYLYGIIDACILLSWSGTRGNERNDFERQKWSFECNKILLYQLNTCKKILTAGSQAEYGPYFDINNKLKEDHVAVPNTEYGKFKLEFFFEANEFCKQNNIRLIEPRFFSLYGPGDYAGTLIMTMLFNMLNNIPCNLTECKQLWDFLYIDDAVDGLLKLLQNNCDSGIYNFGSGYSAPLKYYIEQMYKITHSSSILNYGAYSYPITGIVNINPCVDKLKSLGWRPKISFSEGIARMLKSYSSNDIL